MGEKLDEKEIVDVSGENFRILPQKCSYILVVVVLIVFVGYFLYLALPELFTGVYISVILLILFAFSLCYFSRSRGNIRKFIISDTRIEFHLPDRDGFYIEWSQFDSIDIRLKILNIKPFHLYEICFIKGERRSVVNFSLSDFQKENIKQILKLLKEYSGYQEKEFKACKEEICSGVYLVDDFEV